jgi:hypothetical protein
MPNRARSKRLAAVAMNSIAQHAVPNGIGQSEFARPQLTRKSRRVVTQPPATTGRTTRPTSAMPSSIPLQRSLLPDVREADRENRHEHQHLAQAEETRRARGQTPSTTAPVQDKRLNAVPHGSMNTVSMSKTMNSIATM